MDLCITVRTWVRERREPTEGYLAALNRLWPDACTQKCECGRIVCYAAYFNEQVWLCNKCYVPTGRY